MKAQIQPRKVTLSEYQTLVKTAREERRRIISSGRSLLTPNTDREVLLKLLNEVFRLHRADRVHLTTSECVGLFQLKGKIQNNEPLHINAIQKLESLIVSNQIYSGLVGIDWTLNDSDAEALDDAEALEVIESTLDIDLENERE